MCRKCSSAHADVGPKGYPYSYCSSCYKKSSTTTQAAKCRNCGRIHNEVGPKGYAYSYCQRCYKPKGLGGSEKLVEQPSTLSKQTPSSQALVSGVTSGDEITQGGEDEAVNSKCENSNVNDNMRKNKLTSDFWVDQRPGLRKLVVIQMVRL